MNITKGRNAKKLAVGLRLRHLRFAGWEPVRPLKIPLIGTSRGFSGDFAERSLNSYFFLASPPKENWLGKKDAKPSWNQYFTSHQRRLGLGLRMPANSRRLRDAGILPVPPTSQPRRDQAEKMPGGSNAQVPANWAFLQIRSGPENLLPRICSRSHRPVVVVWRMTCLGRSCPRRSRQWRRY